MNRKMSTLFKLLFLVLLMSSCGSIKDIAYFQKYDSSTTPPVGVSSRSTTPSNQPANQNTGTKTPRVVLAERNSAGLFDARIKPKDILCITVVSSEPEASRIYNLVVPQLEDNSNPTNLLSQPVLQTYLVDNEGNIDFPVFGKIRVAGFTRKELESMFQKKLAAAFSKETPIITIRFINYSVNVLGEVQKPGKYTTNNDRLTLFEGLAQAGDLTIYGRRDNVKVLRENADGSKAYITVNLNDKNVIYSPAYYLEQNDVVYVEPNTSRSKSSNFGAAESFGISSLSVLLSLTSLIFTVFNLKL